MWFGAVVLASGPFVSREHETRGTARVLRLADGSVVVWCARFHVVFGAADLTPDTPRRPAG
jgi:hypothetical protein